MVNFSSDYIIMKLDFRVKYDTDVEKVRKIVKKINLPHHPVNSLSCVKQFYAAYRRHLREIILSFPTEM